MCKNTLDPEQNVKMYHVFHLLMLFHYHFDKELKKLYGMSTRNHSGGSH